MAEGVNEAKNGIKSLFKMGTLKNIVFWGSAVALVGTSLTQPQFLPAVGGYLKTAVSTGFTGVGEIGSLVGNGNYVDAYNAFIGSPTPPGT